jgi:hypothetical protein
MALSAAPNVQQIAELPNIEKYIQGMDRHIQLGYKSWDSPEGSLSMQPGPMWIEGTELWHRLQTAGESEDGGEALEDDARLSFSWKFL